MALDPQMLALMQQRAAKASEVEAPQMIEGAPLQGEAAPQMIMEAPVMSPDVELALKREKLKGLLAEVRTEQARQEAEELFRKKQAQVMKDVADI